MVETSKKAQRKHEWDTLVAEVDGMSKWVIGLEKQTMERVKNFSVQEFKHRKRNGEFKITILFH